MTDRPASRMQGQAQRVVRLRTEPRTVNDGTTDQARRTGETGHVGQARAVRLPAARVTSDRHRAGDGPVDGIPANPAVMSFADARLVWPVNRSCTVSTPQPELQRKPSLSPSSLASVVDRDTLQQAIRGEASTTMSPDRGRRSIVAPGSGALIAALRHPGSLAAKVHTDQPLPGPSRPNTIRPVTVAGEQALRLSGPDVGPVASALSTRPAVMNPRLQRSLNEPLQRSPTPDLGDRFLSELSETIQRRPAPLPMQFRPMADAIAGRRSVMLSTDHASRRALRSVGKVAATVSDVIHFDPGHVPGHRVSEVIAHELTHIAHPSPKPRFFDDIDDGPEERQAEQMAKTMSRSPLRPSASLLTPPKVGTSAPAQRSVIRRSPAGSAPVGPAPVINASGIVSAAALAAQMTGAPAAVPRSTASVQAALSMVVPTPAAAPAAAPPARAPSASQMFDTPAADEWFKEQLRDNFSHIMNMIEDRMIEELERRGGRIWGGL
ncbi:DUF4157 domain-containing protein [Ilumatobacter sp.]|uniref:eCIS core domain-containing protein n=1 Tax=Ilumatobacter sp. TaxID=1967498 RepID=UPI003750628A